MTLDPPLLDRFPPPALSTPAAAPAAGNAPAAAPGAAGANPWAALRQGGGMPGMPGMPGGGQMDPAMMQQMMSNPMVQQVRRGGPAEEGGAREGGGGVRSNCLRGATFCSVN